jgi:hypothetical protein
MARLMEPLGKVIASSFLTILLSSCGDEGGSGSKPVANVFARKVYSTMNRNESIRIISNTEIEHSDRHGNLVGSYTREGNKIRAVF